MQAWPARYVSVTSFSPYLLSAVLAFSLAGPAFAAARPKPPKEKMEKIHEFETPGGWKTVTYRVVRKKPSEIPAVMIKFDEEIEKHIEMQHRCHLVVQNRIDRGIAGDEIKKGLSPVCHKIAEELQTMVQNRDAVVAAAKERLNNPRQKNDDLNHDLNLLLGRFKSGKFRCSQDRAHGLVCDEAKAVPVRAGVPVTAAPSDPRADYKMRITDFKCNLPNCFLRFKFPF